MKISVELVPRDEGELRLEALVVKSFPEIDELNIPDLPRLPLTSLEAHQIVSRLAHCPITVHLRACDYGLSEIGSLVDRLEVYGVRRVLVVKGDESKLRPHYETTSAQLIEELLKRKSDLRVYAGYNCYLSSDKAFDDVRAKLCAGAVGFYTQPVFSDAHIYDTANYLMGSEVYFGFSPLTSENSKRYWEKQGCVFEPTFAPNLEYSVGFTVAALRFIQRLHIGNSYLMPIKTPVEPYLSRLFG